MQVSCLFTTIAPVTKCPSTFRTTSRTRNVTNMTLSRCNSKSLVITFHILIAVPASSSFMHGLPRQGEQSLISAQCVCSRAHNLIAHRLGCAAIQVSIYLSKGSFFFSAANHTLSSNSCFSMTAESTLKTVVAKE